MSVQHADGWIIVKIDGVDPHYRLFFGFEEEQSNGKMWKLNDGITSAEVIGDVIVFTEVDSNIVCYCVIERYGKFSHDTLLELQDLCRDPNTTALFQLPDVKNTDWLI